MSDYIKLVARNCVNSNWAARFLADENEECCQCSFGECKVAVMIAFNGHKEYKFILTESELKAATERLQDKAKE